MPHDGEVEVPEPPDDPQRDYKKWVAYTWWDFFDDNVVARLEPGTIVASSPVTRVDSSERTYDGDRAPSPRRRVPTERPIGEKMS